MISIKRNSIQAKLMVFFTVLTMVLFVSVGSLFFQKTKAAINEAKETELRTLADETANKIDRFLFERFGDAEVMARSPLLRKADVGIELKLELMGNVRNTYKAYDYIFISDLEGNIEAYSGDVNEDEEYKKWLPIVTNEKVFISDFVYLEHEKIVVVYLIAPILDEDGKIKNVVVERMNFNAISDIVKNVRPGNTGYAYILQDNGNALLHPKNISKITEAIQNEGIKPQYREYEGIRFISYASLIKKYDTQKSNWYLTVEEPEKEAFEVSYRLRNYTIAVVFISLFILFILAAIVSRKIARPIEKLFKETQNIMEGEHLGHIEIESSDEIGTIAKSFNAVLFNLKSMMQQVLEISAEAASLNEVREYADKFFENTPNAIITIDNKGNITFFNHAAGTVTGIKEDEIIGKKITEESHEGILALTNLLYEGILSKVIYIKHIVKITNTKNEELLVMLTTSIQTDSKGRTIGVIGVFKTVEELKSFENSMLRAKNLASLGALSAGVAHEIRNPLTSIRGYAQYVKRELGEENELSEDVDIIIHEVDRLNGIIDRFLIFARPKELKLKFSNINDVINDALRLISKDILLENIHVVTALDKIPIIAIDYEQIEQVILNITLNAIQAMSGQGILKISTVYIEKLNVIQIEIEDSGVGIEPKDCENIFEPFFTTKEKGTGLGLAICSTIIENHKGFIEVSSTPGRGTKFTIKIPIKK